MGHIDAEILLAQPRGFCAGVDRAIQIVEEAIAQFGQPIYVRHQIIHNARVIEDLTAKGAIFIEELNEVPAGATLIFSAHGVSAKVRQDATLRGFRIFDATCPLVNKVHVEVTKFHKEGIKVLMIGHAGHPEVIGTMGQVDSDIYLIESVQDVEHLSFSSLDRIAYVTQTTLSVDETQEIIEALLVRYPHIIQPKKQDICYATQNRQDAVKVMVPLIDMMVVVGSANSSNSNRLKELAARLGVDSYLVDHPNQLAPEWFVDKKRIGITAGASAPEALTQQIIHQIKSYGSRVVKTLPGIEETTIFSMPKGLVS
ncbi:4-hydroxy-3-methylbut-2-enyl diphosphate reductase [Polynucleobacter kasalickyi]|uniref:4-hydroxy-3-methylbut-2-enyl diphosphate reductase n=1 Tax=Polynucleobacter kasalickyi TaxID=1938817 RepID=A0A1W1Z427_9BURK|nr:4-hydroxy-3-methylbut-2-enyl diphosphate reductase [Polynucleobacter kasalickyi]SMC43133.1 4-hydroxy-3-methylbut-2-enyl diphosphate reductase [Polynucleobacter kasalickyi]